MHKFAGLHLLDLFFFILMIQRYNYQFSLQQAISIRRYGIEGKKGSIARLPSITTSAKIHQIVKNLLDAPWFDQQLQSQQLRDLQRVLESKNWKKLVSDKIAFLCRIHDINSKQYLSQERNLFKDQITQLVKDDANTYLIAYEDDRPERYPSTQASLNNSHQIYRRDLSHHDFHQLNDSAHFRVKQMDNSRRSESNYRNYSLRNQMDNTETDRVLDWLNKRVEYKRMKESYLIGRQASLLNRKTSIKEVYRNRKEIPGHKLSSERRNHDDFITGKSAYHRGRQDLSRLLNRPTKILIN